METPVFMMSYPRRDWGIHGGANFLSAMANEKPPNPRAAMNEWICVAKAIEAAGGAVMVLPPPPHENLTGLPYMAEAGEFYLDEEGLPAFILARMRAPHRQPEPTWVGGFVSALGWGVRSVSSIWEAQGDAIRIGNDRIIHTHGAGPMSRSEAAAYNEVAHLLSPHHLQLAFRAFPWFHGNTFLASYRVANANETVVLACSAALEPEQWGRLKAFCGDTSILDISREVSLKYATNALQVCNTIISPAGLGDVITGLWRDLALEVIELPLCELHNRGGGAAVCLTNELHGMNPDWIPKHLRFADLLPGLEELAEDYPNQQLGEGF